MSIKRNIYVRLLSGGILFSSCFIAHGMDDAQNKLSTLTSGIKESQLNLPYSEPLKPQTPLMEKALATYNKLPFDVGERIRYLITYLGVKGGTAEMNVRTPIKWKDSWSHRITAEAISAEWVSWFTVLHDSVETIINSNSEWTPQRFYINQNEGSFHQSRTLRFDETKSKIIQTTKKKDKKEETEDFEFRPSIKDAVGAIYYFRQQIAQEKLGAEFSFDVYTDQKTWTAKGKHVRRETMKVEGIKYDCDLYDLKTKLGSHLQQKGSFRMWITHDERRLPVYIEADVKFGAIKLSLVQWDQGFVDPKVKKTYTAVNAESP